MSNENQTNQPVEDVFSSLDEGNNDALKPDLSDSPVVPNSSVTESVPTDSTSADLDLSESSIGQEQNNIPSSTSKNHDVPMEMEKKSSGMVEKLLFYLILFLIILLGAFAIWALVF